jgi:hypothetical protein
MARGLDSSPRAGFSAAARSIGTRRGCFSGMSEKHAGKNRKMMGMMG